jgi:PAS domain S-box-containing protein
MDGAKFADQLREISENVSVLSGLGETHRDANPQLAKAIDKLLAVVEALRVAEEELRQQHDELVAAREALEGEVRRYQDLFEFAPDGYLVTDLKGVVQEANHSASRILNAPPEYLAGKPLVLFVSWESRQAFLTGLSRLPGAERLDEWEMRLAPRYSEQTFDAAVSVSVMRARHGAPDRLRWLIRDVSQRKQAERQLQQEQRFLRQLIQAHERDRQLLAYEIHDGLVQILSGALLHLESFADEQSGLSPRARREFQMGLDLMRRAVGDSRRLISGLRPLILDEHGIVMAIEYLIAEQTAPRGPSNVRFIHDVQFDRLEPLLEGNLFRIVQEALTNAQRHSQAEEVVIRLKQTDRQIRLRVSDDGVGFDPTQMAENRFGLEGIRKRAALLGGNARIESAPGQGTRIEVDLPLLEPTGTL